MRTFLLTLQLIVALGYLGMAIVIVTLTHTYNLWMPVLFYSFAALLLLAALLNGFEARLTYKGILRHGRH